MKLIGNLKNQVEKANSKEEAKEIIEKAGMRLMDDELEMVTGGMSIPRPAETYATTDHAPCVVDDKQVVGTYEKIAQSGGYTPGVRF